jgi:hypothetical protein
MAFQDEVQNYINNYVEGHIPSKDEILKQFTYIEDEELQKRIAKEYYIARYIYKFFEGMESRDELLDAEVRLQVIMFANIYEAIIHYVLFTKYSETQIVKDLEYVQTPIEISIPSEKKKEIEDALQHSGKSIKTYYMALKRRDLTKVRFDEKAEAAFSLGLIDNDLKDEIINFYNLRNGIHLHAEIRKNIIWDLEMSKMAYWRIEKINLQVSRKMKIDNKITV